MAYDRANWHYGGHYPDDLPPENGATHIGMSLAWAIHRGLEGAIHHDHVTAEEALGAVRTRQMTGREFLVQQCDKKFCEDDLSDEGNRFAQHYCATK